MTQTTASVLNDLIKTLKDGELGFTTAADDAEKTDLKGLFREYAEQRSEFSSQLQKHVELGGEEAEDSGSLAGDVHRGWINLKSAVTSRTDLAILEECERGEDSTLKMYREALASGVLGSARPLVEQQFPQVKSAHDRVKILRDALRQESEDSDNSGSGTMTGGTVLI